MLKHIIYIYFFCIKHKILARNTFLNRSNYVFDSIHPFHLPIILCLKCQCHDLMYSATFDTSAPYNKRLLTNANKAAIKLSENMFRFT